MYTCTWMICFGCCLHFEDLKQVSPSSWLKDVCIHTYISIMTQGLEGFHHSSIVLSLSICVWQRREMRDVQSPFTSSFVSRVSSWFLQILIYCCVFVVLFVVLFVCVWQRREMRGGSALFVDQAPVRAATHGRILILDGIDKAEVNYY